MEQLAARVRSARRVERAAVATDRTRTASTATAAAATGQARAAAGGWVRLPHAASTARDARRLWSKAVVVHVEPHKFRTPAKRIADGPKVDRTISSAEGRV